MNEVVSDKLNVEIGARIRHWRRLRGWSQEHLGQKLPHKKRQQDIYSYECGLRLGPRVLIELAMVFGVTTDCLMGGKDSITSNAVSGKKPAISGRPGQS